MAFSIIIPVFNEEENIGNLIQDIYSFLRSSDYIYEVIVVNDASKDSTYKTLVGLNKKYPIIIISNQQNMGQSFSIWTGINNSKYDTIVTIDGDGQNNPKDIIKLLHFYKKENYKLVSGIRKKRKDGLAKRYSSLIANSVRSFILKDDCKDTGCSLKIFDKNIFLKIPFFKGMHRFIPAFFLAFGCKALYIDVDHRERKYGKSKYGTIDRLVVGIMDLIKVFSMI